MKTLIGTLSLALTMIAAPVMASESSSTLPSHNLKVAEAATKQDDSKMNEEMKKCMEKKTADECKKEMSKEKPEHKTKSKS